LVGIRHERYSKKRLRHTVTAPLAGMAAQEVSGFNRHVHALIA
jgi:hypothetical protein